MTAIVFPGQGSQYIGMASDFYENFNEAKLVFEEISDYVALDLKKLIFENPERLLDLTNYTQIAIFTASMAIFKSIEKIETLEIDKSNIMMGHSLGEYTALASSNKINLDECSKVLKKRGDLMHNAVKPNTSGMAALIGCDANKIIKIIKENKIDLEIANDNSPIQVVISGDINEIKNNEKIFLDYNVKKFVKLNVSAAFHSKFMFKAQESLSNDIDKLNFVNNNIKIISNFSGKASNDNIILKNSLKKQMSNQVRWTESIINLEKLGVSKIIEVGPGKVLSGLIRRISNKFDIVSINKVTDL